MNIKNALLIARHDYYKWLHKIRVAKFLGQKKGKGITVVNVTSPAPSVKNILYYRFEDDSDDVTRECEINRISDGKGGFKLEPVNSFQGKSYVFIGLGVEYDF